MIVVDTNVVAYLLIEGIKTPEAAEILRRDADWVAPLLWKSEFRNLLALYVKGGHRRLAEALEIMEAADGLMGNKGFPVDSARVLDLAAESGCTAYDSEFVALAEELGVPLVTWDRAILEAFPRVAVEPSVFCR